MDYLIIDVPDKNDSLSNIVLNNHYHQIRFTYNDSMDYWTFGIYNDKGTPLYTGMKIVPNMVLNLFHGMMSFGGMFLVKTTLTRIGRYSFVDGDAQFIYVPFEIVEDE